MQVKNQEQPLTMSNQSDNGGHGRDKAENSRPKIEELMTAAAAEAADKADRLTSEAAEFRSESQRLRAEARKILKQADELNKQGIDLEADSKVSRDLSKSLLFETMLQRLSRNDESLVHIDSKDSDLPDGYGRALGKALRKNTVVTKMVLNLSTIFSSESRVRLWRASEMNESDFDRRVSGEMEKSLLQFLETSTSLQDVYVCYPSRILDQPTLFKAGNLLLNALARSKRLNDLRWTDGVPSSGICTLLRTSQSLRRINIALDDIVNYSVDDRRALASAFGSNKTLEEFALQLPTQEQNMAVRILGKLHNIRSLRRLCLTACGDYDESYYNTLSRYLLSAKGTLQEFEMQGFSLDDSMVETILSGLVHDSSGANGCASTTISRLIFKDCDWDDDAVERFAVFLQTAITNGNGERVYDSKLRNVSILGEYEMEHSLSRHLAASLFVEMSFNGNDGGMMIPTIGSQLKVMQLDEVEPAFFQQLSGNAHLVQLQELRLHGISKLVSVAFAKCMPLLKSILVLGLSGVASGTTPWLVHGLKRNGSVQDCHVSDDDFSASERLLIDAFCQRNQHFDQLMESERAGTKNSKETAHPSQAGLVLGSHPLMLQVAQQVPITQEAMLIRGLLSMGEHDSPCPTASMSMDEHENSCSTASSSAPRDVPL